MHGNPAHPGGFTLLEVLVAFVIAALALAVLYSGGIEGLLATRTATRRDEAVARAAARLEAMCHGARLAPGRQSGDDGSGFSWRSQVQVAESAIAAARQRRRAAPAAAPDAVQRRRHGVLAGRAAGARGVAANPLPGGRARTAWLMRGFTLLEVLAALAVLGLLLAGLAQGVQFGLRAWDCRRATWPGATTSRRRTAASAC